ncbi:MAG: galactitol-1-phosphate 5-dehydrogenase [bacterium]
MKAAVLHAIDDLRIENVPTPTLIKGEEACIIKINAAGVCGSDISRVFKDGTYSFPLIPGHEFAGEIIETGNNCPYKIGQIAAIYPLLPCRKCPSCLEQRFQQCDSYNYFGSRCDGGFAEYIKVPYWNIVPAPDGVSAAEAALCEPASVAQHGMRNVKVTTGDSVLIFGAGAIGLMMAQWAFIFGASNVVLADISNDKLNAGRKIVPDAEYINSMETSIEEVLKDRKFNVAVEGTGAPAIYQQVIKFTAKNGRILLLGNPSKDVLIERSIVSQLLRKELTIHGTWNSTLEPYNEWAATLQAISESKLNVKNMITHRYQLDDALKALHMMREGKTFFNRVILDI